MPTTPVMSRLRKKKPLHPEIPSQEELEETKINVQKATTNFVNAAEEYEREWRAIPERIEEWLHTKEDKMNRAFARVLEEQERENRLQELFEYAKESKVPTRSISKDVAKEAKIRQEEKENREYSKAYTTIKEEEERIRRIAEESWQQDVAEEQRLTNAAYTKIAEEKERDRRVAEDSYMQEVEEEYRKQNKAYVKIAEEKERDRRLAEESYCDEKEEEYRKNEDAWTKIAEEQERARRIAEDSYQDELQEEASKTDHAYTLIKEEEERQRRLSFPVNMDDLAVLKTIAKAAADAASKKNWVKRQTGGLRKSKTNNMKRSSEHRVWLPKQGEEISKGAAKKEEIKKEEKHVSSTLKPTAKPFVPKQAVEPTVEIKSLEKEAKKTEPSKKAEPTTERKLSKSAERKKAKKAAKKQQQQLATTVVPEVAIPTSIQMTSVEPKVLLSTVQSKPLEDRKEVVDRMSRELFDRIASKVLRHESRR